MINNFKATNKNNKTVNNLNTIVKVSNKHFEKKTKGVNPKQFQSNHIINFGEVVEVLDTSTNIFKGTFYDGSGTKVGATSPFYNVDINCDNSPNAEVGSIFCAMRYPQDTQWYCLALFQDATGTSVKAKISQEISYTGYSYYKATLINDDGTDTTTPATEITINRIITESGVKDFTEYAPWFVEDDIVEVFQSDVDVADTWYIKETFTFIDNASVNSLAVTTDGNKRLKAVWV